MAKRIVLTMPDETLIELSKAFSSVYRRPDKIINEDGDIINNTVSEKTFTKNKVLSWFAEVEKKYVLMNKSTSSYSETALKAQAKALTDQITVSVETV